MTGTKDFLLNIIANLKLIISLASSDFKTKYAGSYLGVLWAFIQPIVSILVFWFVFQVGLKITPTEENVPFALWFICGLVPWFFFSDSLMNATNSFSEYSFLVKKVVFRISILPIVKVISSLYIHIAFIVLLLTIYFSYGYAFSINSVGIFYYTFCMFVFSVGLGYITSSIIIFFKDLGQIVGVFLQFGMWLTPIMWSHKLIPGNLTWIFEYNPMYYIVEGYRNSLLLDNGLMLLSMESMRFWGISVFTLVLGFYIFKKLKSHFADVL